MLVRFRTGHHPALRRWQAMVDDSVPTDCRLCERREETMEHLWLECEALEVGRSTSGLVEELGELTSKPIQSLALLRIILRRLEDAS